MQDKTAEGKALAELVAPIMMAKDQDAGVIGIALTHLVAHWMARHPPDARRRLGKAWVLLVNDLVPKYVESMIKEGTVGEEWREE